MHTSTVGEIGMARGRMLNKSVCRSRKFQQLPNDTCRLLATWIISHLDKRGVYHGDPAIVKSYVFPRRRDVTIEDVDRYLDDIQEAGLLVRFTARGDQWQWWPGFLDNQVGLRADRETTDFPPPPDEPPEGWGEHAGSTPDTCRNDAGKKPAEEKLSEEKRSRRGRARNHNAFSAYQQATAGTLSPMLSDRIGDLIDECENHRQRLPPTAKGSDVSGDGWVCAAIREAVGATDRISVNYLAAILDRWRAEGFKSKRNNNHPDHQSKMPKATRIYT